MYSSKKKMTIGREGKPTLRVPVDTSKSSSALTNVGKTAKNFAYNPSSGFVRGVETNNNAVGFTKEKEQRLPTDFSWDKLMPEKWSAKAVQWPKLGDWWRCPSGKMVLFGVAAGLLIVAANAASERISADTYSGEGYALLHGGDPQQAVSYFHKAAIAESSRMWTGAPRHLAALEGLASAYERAGYSDSALQTLEDECQILSKAVIKDDVRLISALTLYAEFLDRHGRGFESTNVRERIHALQQNSDGAIVMLLVLASLANYGVYAAFSLLLDKLYLPNWRRFFGLSVGLYLGMVACAFHSGLPLLAVLVGAGVLEFLVLPALIAFVVAVGRALAPHWSNCLTTPSQRSGK